MATETNITRLMTVAKGLGPLRNDVAFVGGAVVGLYATDPAATEIRSTDDVDCVIEVSSQVEYNALEEELRSLHFHNDTTIGAPLCRWKFKDITVDVMPTDPSILGFTNKWYAEGLSRALDQLLPDGTSIKILPSPYFLASKLEAYKGRGNGETRTSPDIEDLVYVLDNRGEVANEVVDSDEPLRKYLAHEFRLLLEDASIDEAIASALSFGAGGSQVAKVKHILQKLAGTE
ncbi:MAG: hypothetical protein ACKVRP_05450 [Bacteroidota bacterium]